MNVYLKSVCLMGVYLTGYASHGCITHWRTLHLGVHLMSVYLIGVCLMDVYLTGCAPHGCASWGVYLIVPHGRVSHECAPHWVCTS
jgi:hypothetical membrane protein